MRTPRHVLSCLFPAGWALALPALFPPPASAASPLAWKLGPEDFAFFSLARKEIRQVPAPNGGFREEQVRSTPALPSHGVFGWEVTGKPGYFQTSDLLLLPFSVGTHLPGGEASPGKKPAAYVFPWLGPYKRVVLRGFWVTSFVKGKKGLLRQEGRFTLFQPRGKILYRGLSLPWEPPARSLEGTRLTLRREVDLLRGRVLSLETRLAGNTRPWDAPKGKNETPLDTADRYDLVKIYPYRYPAFQKDVRRAIAGGVKAVRSEMALGWRFQPVNPSDPRDFHAGRAALALLTLLKAEVPPKDPLVRKCLGYLRTQPVLNTYSLGIACMALEALYAPPGERQELVQGLIDHPYPRKPSPADKALLKKWTDRLLSFVDPRVDKAYLARWRYIGEKDWDNSNTQYAVLGLHSAVLCGIHVPLSVFNGVTAHFIAQQDKTGPWWTVPRIVTYKELALARRSGRAYASGSAGRIRARGFSYTFPGNPTGSMTTAGIASLTIASSRVPPRARRGKAWGKLRRSLRAADAWLSLHFSVRENPMAGRTWYLYYLYGLERAMELGSIARFGGRDWYWEGAVHLLTSRKGPRGGWFGLENTCFAVLFLKKSQLPVTTGRR